MKTKFLTCLLLIASFVFGLAGCEAKTIEKAEKASAKLAGYANAGVEVTRELFRDGLIGVQAKDRIADAFIVLAKGGVAFDAAVANTKAEYGRKPPKEAIEALFAVFNAEVVAKFLSVLQQLKLIGDSGAYVAIIESLKTAVLVVAAAFGKRPAVEVQL